MVDVDKLSDAELRTKLLEFGFPVMPITGTTRKVMVKKLKMLVENRKKTASQDRRSLAKYSSEEESDSEVKSSRRNAARRATMAAPPPKVVNTRKNPAVKTNDSDNESENSVTTTREIKVVSTTRSKVVKPNDEFDTGSESESELNKSPSRFETKTTYSPGRYTSTYLSPGADRLSQIRSRLSLGASTSYDSPLYPSLRQETSGGDTPFLSNFTKHLSDISANKSFNSDFDYKNDVIKEHDSNGGSSYTRSYFNRPLPRRDLLSREFQTQQKNNFLKNNVVSFVLIGLAFLTFFIIFVLYCGLRSDSSALDTSGYIIPYCNTNEPNWKRGVNCLLDGDVVGAINMQKVLQPQLQKIAITAKCSDYSVKPYMSESEIIHFVYNNYGLKNISEIRKHLEDFELLTFKNPNWDISVIQTDIISPENALEDMESVIAARQTKTINLAVLSPSLSWQCHVYNKLSMFVNIMLFSVIAFLVLYLMNYAYKYLKWYHQKREGEVCLMVEKIIDVLQTNAGEEGGNPFLVINHVRDMILPINDRKRLESAWKQAVKYIADNDSRVRTEIQIVQGEPYEVWRWLGGAGTSPRSKTWQGQAFETQVGSVNSLPCSPTPCLKIRGMVDEGDRNFHTIREAVLSKCAHQCRILHCVVEPTSKCVYLKCADTSDAAVAYRNLHGWWYAGHLVTVKYLRLERYMQRFPESPLSGPPYLKAVSPAADWTN